MKAADELDLHVTAVGYLAATGCTDSEIQELLYGGKGILLPETRERAATNDNRARAFAAGFLRTVVDERKAPPAFLRELRSKVHMDPSRDVLKDLKLLSKGVVQSICVTRSDGHLHKSESDKWSARLNRFASLSAWRVSELMDRLPEDSVIATSFGRTIGMVLEGVLDRDAMLGHKANGSRVVIPLMGDPLGIHLDFKSASATNHARRLQSRFLLPRGADSAISLEGIPPVLPQKAFANNDQLQGARALVQTMRSFRKVFGPTSDPKKPPLIERARLAIVSCGSFRQGWDVYANELIEEGAVSIQELQKHALGNFCGDLVVRPAHSASNWLDRIRELWTGARLVHYQQMATRAMVDGVGGTVVVLIDDSKAEVLTEICRLGGASHICCDEDAAQGLRRILAIIRRTGELQGIKVCLG